MTNEEGVFHNNFFRINYNDNIERDYLVYYLKMEVIREILLLKAGITTIPDLNHDDFLDTPIIVYPKNIQNEIVEYLNGENFKIDNTIQKIETKTKLLEEYKKSIIHHVVTGKVNVRGLNH
ncbi:MAG: restriction endonuclease subunit S [Methanobacterium sp. ERen5]|nr:MAG: restriction endonuclease subunit S [Methanobacterium sp. ERen5]